MNSYKIGRNDPCPCGSGKKYKNCCLSLDEIAGTGLDMFERYNQLLIALKVKLDNQYGSALKRIKREARQSFLRFASMGDIPADHEALFSDWLWFDYRDQNGLTRAQEYYDEHGKYMDKNWAECLQELACSSLSIYIPMEVSDAYLLLKDLISGSTCQVMLREPWQIDENLQNVLLLGRLVNTSQGSLFSGMVLMQKNDAGQKEFIQSNLDYFQLISKLSGADFTRQHGEIVYGVFCHALNKTKLSLNDIRAYSVSNPQELLQNISSTDLLPLYQADGWQWLQPKGCSGYVRIAIGKDTVLICTDLVEDLPVVNAWLDRWGRVEVINVSNLLHSPDLNQTSLWFTIMKDQETERWLHTPHRELDGQTPSELLEEESGRQKLIGLLDTFTQEEIKSEEEEELLFFMRERIKGVNPQ